MNMKKILSIGAVIALLVVGTGMRTVSASDGEILNRIMLLLSQLNTNGAYATSYHQEDVVRFDAIDSKLERVYEACGRGSGTSARRTTLAQVNACIDACFVSSRIGEASEGVVQGQRFSSCIARCPSNTLRNIECAGAYISGTSYGGGGVTLASGEVVIGGRSPSAFTSDCTALRGRSREAVCRSYGEMYRSNLGACLFDQTAYTCQNDCAKNYRDDAGLLLCQFRCQNRSRASERFEQLQASGFITEDGRLNAGTLSHTAVAPLAPTIQAVTPSTPSVSPTVPAPETYSQCVYRCDADRTACIERNAKTTDCQPTYESCYMGCGSRLTGGSSR